MYLTYNNNPVNQNRSVVFALFNKYGTSLDIETPLEGDWPSTSSGTRLRKIEGRRLKEID